MSSAEGGHQRLRQIVARQRIGETPHLGKHIAAIEHGRRVIRLQRQSAIETGHCLLGPVQGLERATAVVKRVDRFRIELDGLLHDPFRVGEFAALEMKEAQHLQRAEMARVHPQHVVIKARRLGEIARLVQPPGVLQDVVVHGENDRSTINRCVRQQNSRVVRPADVASTWFRTRLPGDG